MFEVAGNHKDGVPSAYLGHAIRAAGGAVFFHGVGHMPVNEEHDYRKFIKECAKFYSATGEKIGVGILLFKQYRFVGGTEDDKAYMEKAIAMLETVKDSIINTYEIKSGLSRAKLSHLMDAETWMDANNAVELGFADGILSRSDTGDEAPPAGSALFSQEAVVNSLMGKIAQKCKIEHPILTGRSIDTLMERLELLKF